MTTESELPTQLLFNQHEFKLTIGNRPEKKFKTTVVSCQNVATRLMERNAILMLQSTIC